MAFLSALIKREMNCLKYIAFTAILLASICSLQASESAIVNETCPVTPEELVENHITTVYNGETIGFCCKSCRRKFIANPDAYTDQLAMHDQGQHLHEELGVSLRAGSQFDHQREPEAHDSEHDHATDHTQPSQSLGNRILILFGKLHVVVVHLPLALLPLSALFELVGTLRDSKLFQNVARINFIVGSFSAVIAAAFGWIAKGQSTYSGDLDQILNIHQTLGFSVVGISLVGLLSLAAVRYECEWGQKLYRLVLLIAFALVPLAGHFGGALIYGSDYFKF